MGQRAYTTFGEYRGTISTIGFVPPFISETYDFETLSDKTIKVHYRAVTKDNSPVVVHAKIRCGLIDIERMFRHFGANYAQRLSHDGRESINEFVTTRKLSELRTDTLSKSTLQDNLDSRAEDCGISVVEFKLGSVTVLGNETGKRGVSAQHDE